MSERVVLKIYVEAEDWREAIRIVREECMKMDKAGPGYKCGGGGPSDHRTVEFLKPGEESVP